MTVFIIISVAAMMLAASLTNLELQSDFRFSSSHREEISEYSQDSEPDYDIEILYRIMLIITGVLVPVSILGLFMSKKGRWKLLAFLVFFTIWAFWIPTLEIQFPKFNFIPQSAEETQDNGLLSPGDRVSAPPLWLVLVISLGFSILITGGIFFLWRRFWRRPKPIEMIERETQKTIDGLISGFEWKEGVIRYYQEMTKAIKDDYGLSRKKAMTTREFEKNLETIGLAIIPVKRLTRLFEKARYGVDDLDKSENEEAVACLSEILKACREVK